MFAVRLIRIGYIEHDKIPLGLHHRATEVLKNPQGFRKHETSGLEEQVIVSENLANALTEVIVDAERWVKHSIGNTAPMECFYAAIMAVELERRRFWYDGGTTRRYNLLTREVI